MRHIDLGKIRYALGSNIIHRQDVLDALADHEEGYRSTFTEWVKNLPICGNDTPVCTHHKDRYNTKFTILTIPGKGIEGFNTHIMLGHRF